MTNNKSFFQKLSDSLTSLFPFNSTSRDTSNPPQVSLDRNISPIRFPSNRRVASEAFGKDEDHLKIKRAKLHHDPLDLPSSRIMKPPLAQLTDKFINCNNFNDTASDFSETSNVSVSTSGVSSLHPRSNKRINLSHSEDITLQTRKYPRNLNLSHNEDSPVINKSLKVKHDFMSSPARKILEKLERLTTPITAGNKLTSYIQRENYLNQTKPSPYSRPKPPIYGKQLPPVKAVTVSASSKDVDSFGGPIRGKKPKQKKIFGYSDMVDIDSNILDTVYPSLTESGQVNFSNIPLLMKSQATNTDESFLGRMSPPLEFTFRAPKSVDDPEHSTLTEQSSETPIKYHFKSRITQEELQRHDQRSNLVRINKNRKLWKCNTCLSENTEDRTECEGCGVLASQNDNHITVSQKMSPVTVDKRDLIKRLLENDNNTKEQSTNETKSINSHKELLFTTSSLATSSQGLFNNANVTVTTDSRLSLFPGATGSISTISEPKTSLFPDVKTTMSTVSASSEPKLFSFGSLQTKSIVTSVELTSSSGISTSITPTVFSSNLKPLSTTSSVVFDTVSISSSTQLTQASMANKNTEPKQLITGDQISTSISCSVDTKPFTFGISTTASSSINTNKPTEVATSSTGIAPTFSFMPVSSVASSVPSSSASSKPFTFGQQTASSTSANTISETKPQMMFGTLPTAITKPDLFGVSTASLPFGSSTAAIQPKADLFGASSTAVPAKSDLFGATTTAVTAKSDLFGASTTAVAAKSDVFGVSSTAAPVKLGLFGTTQNETVSTPESKSISLFGQSVTSAIDTKPFTFGQIQSTSSAVTTQAVTTNQTSLFGASSGFGATATLTASAPTQAAVFSFGAKPPTSEQPLAVTSSNVASTGMYQFGIATQSSSLRPEPLSTSTTSVSLFGAGPLQSSSTNLFGAPSAVAPVGEQPVSKATLPAFNFSANVSTVSSTTPQFGAFNTSFSAKPSSTAAVPKASASLFSGQTQPVSQATVSATGSTSLFGVPATQSVANAFSQPVAPQPAAFQFGATNPPAVPSINTNANSSLTQGAFDFKAAAATPAFQFGGSNAPVANNNTMAPGSNIFDFKAAASPAFQFGASSVGAVNNGSVYSFSSSSTGTGIPDTGSQMMTRRTLKVRRKR